MDDWHYRPEESVEQLIIRFVNQIHGRFCRQNFEQTRSGPSVWKRDVSSEESPGGLNSSGTDLFFHASSLSSVNKLFIMCGWGPNRRLGPMDFQQLRHILLNKRRFVFSVFCKGGRNCFDLTAEVIIGPCHSSILTCNCRINTGVINNNCGYVFYFSQFILLRKRLNWLKYWCFPQFEQSGLRSWARWVVCDVGG